MESIFGGGIEFESKEKFDKFISTIDKTSAIKIIDLSIDFGLKNGLYSLEESYALYMCLNKIKENEVQNSGISDSNSNGSSN